VGHSSGLRGPPQCGQCPCVRLNERCIVLLFAGFKQDSPGCFRGPSGLSPTATRVVRRVACRRLFRLHCASGCLGTSRGSSRGLSWTTSLTPRVLVPRHVARLVMWLVVDYFASRRLLRRAFGCLRTSHGSSSTTSPTSRVRVPRHLTRFVVWLVVDYFTYAARLGASAPRAARRRLLHLRRASGFLGTSHGSSLTTSSMSCVRVPWHVARLVVDYFASHRPVCRASECLGTSRGSSCGSSSTTSPRAGSHATRPGASARRAARRVARRRLLRLAQARSLRV
jgi:hypothetical protein